MMVAIHKSGGRKVLSLYKKYICTLHLINVYILTNFYKYVLHQSQELVVARVDPEVNSSGFCGDI